jgi:hypothetical protein
MERSAVKPATAVQYEFFYNLFLVWHLLIFGCVFDSTLSSTECRLVDFLDVLFVEGAPSADAEKTVAAFRHFNTLFVGRGGVALPRVDRSLKAFRRNRPGCSRFPMPLVLLAALSAVILFRRFNGISVGMARVCVVALFTQFSTYMRPGELRGLLVEDLVRPVPGGGFAFMWYGLIIAPQQRLLPSKTYVFDDTVLLDSPAWLGAEVSRLCLDCSGVPRAKDGLLFDIPPGVLARQLSAATAVLGLPSLCLYQLRHGGASHDALTKVRAMQEIMSRGRWAAASSLKRYTKPGQIQKLVEKADPGCVRMGAWLVERMPLLLTGALEHGLVVEQAVCSGVFSAFSHSRFDVGVSPTPAKRVLKRPAAVMKRPARKS